jgi:hypothetical protein
MLGAVAFLAVLGAAAAASGGAGAESRYKYYSYQGIGERLRALEKQFPDFVEVYTAQERFGLPSFGECGPNSAPCEVWIARVTHEASLRPSSTGTIAGSSGSGDERPEVFFSGALHGNERIGPTTVVEAARLLAEVASCVDQATPDAVRSGTLCLGVLSDADEAMLVAGVPAPSPGAAGAGSAAATAVAVGGSARAYSAREAEVRRRRLLWAHRLVATRSVFVMPAANALGYHLNRREEGSIDPNRDFPFVQVQCAHCT